MQKEACCRWRREMASWGVCVVGGWLASRAHAPPTRRLIPQQLCGLAAAHAHLVRDQAPRRLFCPFRHGAWRWAIGIELRLGHAKRRVLASACAVAAPCNNHSPPPCTHGQGLADCDCDTFCRKCVDPMGEESDHVQLVALTDALQVRAHP